MKRFTLFAIILLTGLLGSIANADIYKWIDENGVIHFTNYSPPKQARILMKTTEITSDEAADKDQMKAEWMEILELAELEIAEKEALIESRLLEADERIAEADQKVEEALQQVQELTEKAESQYYKDRISYLYWRAELRKTASKIFAGKRTYFCDQFPGGIYLVPDVPQQDTSYTSLIQVIYDALLMGILPVGICFEFWVQLAYSFIT